MPPTQSPLPTRRTAKQVQFSQFFTPQGVAAFMAGLFTRPLPSRVRLLDPGAGSGNLTFAFLDLVSQEAPDTRVEADCFELDEEVGKELSRRAISQGREASMNVQVRDFIEVAANHSDGNAGYTHAILNPPYRKINTDSQHRRLLRQGGIETVNLYSGFVAMALKLLDIKGELVAIIPRSFCNGPYYKPFRVFLTKHAAIRRLHLFDSRQDAFKHDDVLQENVILHLIRGAAPGDVQVSRSRDDTFSDVTSHTWQWSDIVFPNDDDMVIHIPSSAEDAHDLPFTNKLTELGISVSTGPVVDFRLREDLRDTPEAGTVPLLYPGHFNARELVWPKPGFRKPNAIVHDKTTEKWLYPSGHYAVVRRFSSKEERRRVVANVVDGLSISPSFLGFENHLNVLHENRRPLPEDVAWGIATYLNSSIIDRHFRRFNGHTQVNASDLKRLTYPDRIALAALGRAARNSDMSQATIDGLVEGMA